VFGAKTHQETDDFTEVMVIPKFARNLISVGRLNDNGNKFVSRKCESELRNQNGETMKFEKESNGMT
jgi:hypothetical protein